jgi:hypothetical protein
LGLAPSHQGAVGGVEKLLQRRTITLQKNQVSAEFQNRNADHYHTAFWGIFIDALVGKRRIAMGKYVLGWLLGVPVIVLVIIYLLFN